MKENLTKKCESCRFYVIRTQEEINSCKTLEETQRFSGYCRRYPKQEEVRYNYLCGEWIDKKYECPFRNKAGFCTNSFYVKGLLCNKISCDVQLPVVR